MSCTCPPDCRPLAFCEPENFGLLFPSLVGPMGPPGGPGTYVQSLALLRLLDPTEFPQGYIANVAGYSEINDGGGGLFEYDSTSSATDNDGTVVMPSNGLGRWLRIFSGPVNVRWFGAKGTGVPDDTAQIQATIDYVGTISSANAEGGEVFVPPGTYLLTGTGLLNTRRNVSFFGAGVGATVFMYNGTGTAITLGDAAVLLAGARMFFGRFTIQATGLWVSGLDVIRMNDFGLSDIEVQGLTVGSGVRIRGANTSTNERVSIGNCAVGLRLMLEGPETSELNTFNGGQIAGNGTNVLITQSQANALSRINIASSTAGPAVIIKSATANIIRECYFEVNSTANGSCSIQLGDGAEVAHDTLIIGNNCVETNIEYFVKCVAGQGNLVIGNMGQPTNLLAWLRCEALAAQNASLFNMHPSGGISVALSDATGVQSNFAMGPSSEIKKTAVGYQFLRALTGSPTQALELRSSDVALSIVRFKNSLGGDVGGISSQGQANFSNKSLTIKTKAGQFVDADVEQAVVATIGWNDTNKKFCVRSLDGSWYETAALTPY